MKPSNEQIEDWAIDKRDHVNKARHRLQQALKELDKDQLEDADSDAQAAAQHIQEAFGFSILMNPRLRE